MLSKSFIILLRSVFGKYQTCMFEISANNDSEWTDDINVRAVQKAMHPQIHLLDAISYRSLLEIK
jgi:hypothetical protein